MVGDDAAWSRPRRPCRRTPRRRRRGCCRRPSTRTGSPASSAPAHGVDQRRPRSSARTQSCAGPPSRSVVWSASRCRRSATQDRHRVAEHRLAGAGDPQRDGARRRARCPAISTSVPSSGTTTGLVNLAPSSAIRPGSPSLLVDVPRGQGEGEHAVRDHVGQADAAGDLGVLVDRVGVAAGRGVGDQVGAGDGVRRAASSAGCIVITHPPCARGWPRRCRPARRSSSVISLEVAMMSVPAIWRSPLDGQRRGQPVADDDRSLVHEPLLAVDDVVQLDADLGVDHQPLHRAEGDHDRERRRRRVAAAYGVPVAAAKSRTACSVTSYGVGRREGAAGQGRVDCHAHESTAERETTPARRSRTGGSRAEDASAGLAVRRVLAAARAELRQLHAVGVVAPVLLGDVVALLALGARERDLGANVAGSCWPRAASFWVWSWLSYCWSGRTCSVAAVAGAGFEPATPRL